MHFVGQKKISLVPKILESLFQPDDSWRVTPKVSDPSFMFPLERQKSFLLLTLYPGQFLWDKETKLMCRDNKYLLLDNKPNISLKPSQKKKPKGILLVHIQ